MKIGNITEIIPGIQSQYFDTTIRKARHRVQEESVEIDGLGRSRESIHLMGDILWSAENLYGNT